MSGGANEGLPNVAEGFLSLLHNQGAVGPCLSGDKFGSVELRLAAGLPLPERGSAEETGD